MALQDLTPQLRTRLSRMERAVGMFVVLATALMVFGFCYYVYQTAQNKGWFKTKAKYFTFVKSAEGLKVGDPVKLMGFDAGRITDIQPMDPRFPYDVYIEFELLAPNDGYMWTEGSVAKVAPGNFLGNRVLEVTKGTGGHSIYIHFPLQDISLNQAGDYTDSNRWRVAEDIYRPGTTQLITRAFRPLTNADAIVAAGRAQVRILALDDKRKALTGIWNSREHRYDVYANTNKPYWLPAEESPPLSDRLETMVNQVQTALPNILALTNQLATVLSNSTLLTSNLNLVAGEARPAVSNLAVVTARLNEPGALGEWLLPTNIHRKLESVLNGADSAVANANTNLAAVLQDLDRSLVHLAGVTSNLNAQVQANSNILSRISQMVRDADTFVQGLKHHWLLRSAFKHSTSKPLPHPPAELRPPKEQDEP